MTLYHYYRDVSVSVSDSSCSAECCSKSRTTPYQPTEKKIIDSTRQCVGNKSETRLVNVDWFDDFKWLSLCTTRKKLFCYYCVQCLEKGTLTFTKKKERAFITEGYGNWKKAVERFRRHEKSECHREAAIKFSAMHHPTISVQLSSQLASDQAFHRRMLVKELSSIKFLLR